VALAVAWWLDRQQVKKDLDSMSVQVVELYGKNAALEQSNKRLLHTQSRPTER